MEVRGLDTISGVPRKAVVTSEEIRESLREPVTAILNCVKNVIEKCKPELVADIVDHGLVLSGGGALLRGLDQLMNEQLGIPVRVADDPLTTVARGTAICRRSRSPTAARLKPARWDRFLRNKNKPSLRHATPTLIADVLWARESGARAP